MSDFKEAMRLTFIHEGGYQNEEDDSGNWHNGINYGTNFGITPDTLFKYHPELESDFNSVKNLTADQASAIYRDGYWKTLYSQISDQNIANKLFDLGVLFGVGHAVELLQIALKPSFPSLAVDKAFGPETLSVVNQVDAKSLLNAYKSAAVAYTLRIAVAKPKDTKWVSGWGRRINS